MKTTIKFVHLKGEKFYQGWKKGEYEDGVGGNIAEEDPLPWVDVQDKLFPRSRQVCLDEKILNKLGMTQRVIRERDFLFFYQLLLPLCDIYLSGIQEGKRLSYYSEVDKWSNLYAYHIGLGG